MITNIALAPLLLFREEKYEVTMPNMQTNHFLLEAVCYKNA